MDLNIDSSNYADAAARTECDYVVTDGHLKNQHVLEMIRTHMWNSVFIGNWQNDVKRFLFYGKDLPKVSDRQRLSFGGLVGPGNPVYDRISNPQVKRLLHVAFGLQTEASELQEQLYKHIFEGAPLDEVNVAEELGDSCWYVGLGCKILGRSLTQVLVQNIAKLFSRYPGKFSSQDALHRNLAAERNTLEGFHTQGVN